MQTTSQNCLQHTKFGNFLRFTSKQVDGLTQKMIELILTKNAMENESKVKFMLLKFTMTKKYSKTVKKQWFQTMLLAESDVRSLS